MIQMIGRNQVATVVIMTIALVIGLLAIGGQIGIKGKFIAAWKIPSVGFGNIAELRCPMLCAINPEGKAFVLDLLWL